MDANKWYEKQRICRKVCFSDASNVLEQYYEEKQLTFILRAEKNSMLSYAIMPDSACVMQIQQ